VSARRIAIELAWRVPVLLLAGVVVLTGLVVVAGLADAEADHSPAFYAGAGTLLIGVGSVIALPAITFGTAGRMARIVALTAALSLQLVPYEVVFGLVAGIVRIGLLVIAYWAWRSRPRDGSGEPDGPAGRNARPPTR
jgi:hypothetical protein